MKTSDFDYVLPPERIAQTPVEPRHNSRLMVMDRTTGDLTDSFFYNIGDFLKPGDLLVINETRVIPARIFARKSTGGKVELLLLKRIQADQWEALVGGKGLHKGVRLFIENGPEVEILQDLAGSQRLIRFLQPVESFLPMVGEMPLPPYIHTHLDNPERYQTVYSRQSGSAAAPTAGLHFTPELMKTLEKKGIRFGRVTLHVGLDTFAPVTEDDVQTHVIHTEWCHVSPETAQLINETKKNGGRVIAVGTTSVRTIESCAIEQAGEFVAGPIEGQTGLFILPGYQFKLVDCMITNFHLPKSTLLMLVSAFAGRERILAAYQNAIEKEYRFYSFGDAMLIQ
jgi:S-adenosylmethionine:tRNA ribosyltransferase-isomerase